ncbi:MAG: inorganic pyrophosphatase [Bacteroidales bacterium]|nr:inorganic pyrophosphatase [Bacteroidales bacterium]
MANKLMDPIGRLMGLRYKSHPWHGVEIGNKAPHVITSYIEVVPSDTVKYEVDKVSGYLKIDRPQKFSNVVPALYGFIPQTYCGDNVAKLSSEKTGRENIKGDGDPLDICVLTEKEITHGDLLVQAIPIGGLRMIDGSEADDKIIAVLKDDAMYGQFKDISELPDLVVNRLRHYFLTYKDLPGEKNADCEITHVYGQKEAYQVIINSVEDYQKRFDFLEAVLSNV